MGMRVCMDCPTLTPAGTTRCPKHAREADRKRGTTTQRGYGAPHQALRGRWQGRIDSGEHITCARGCGTPIRPGDAWDLGHDDRDRMRYRGPECVGCNRATNGRR